jgi:hypothetical protein
MPSPHHPKETQATSAYLLPRWALECSIIIEEIPVPRIVSIKKYVSLCESKIICAVSCSRTASRADEHQP